jgi:hypothetical protein
MQQLLLLALLASPSASSSEGPQLTVQSFGSVQFGAKLADVERRLGEKSTDLDKQRDESCGYVAFDSFPGARWMVEQGTITRVEVPASAPNSLHIRVGDTLDQVRAAHPEVIVEPHKYDPDGKYLIFRAQGGKSGIVMEVGAGKVTDIRGGVEPAV